MKKILLILISFYLISCEDPIDIEIENGESQLVVEAILTNSLKEQKVILSKSGNYFDPIFNEVRNAEISILDNQGNVIKLENNNSSTYSFNPTELPFQDDLTYTLEIIYDNNTFTSLSKLKPVPPIDSITWFKEKVLFGDLDSIIIAQFWAYDLPGLGDTYWIRSKINGTYLDNISIAYDGSTGSGSSSDNIPFIAPVRFSITPNSSDEEDVLKYGDEIEVELYSISTEFANFWKILGDQINNGGLFATPPTNVPTNIKNININGPKAIGWFEISNISTDSATITRDKTNNKE